VRGGPLSGPKGAEEGRTWESYHRSLPHGNGLEMRGAVLAHSLILAVSVPDQEVRYQLPVFFVFPFLTLAYARIIGTDLRVTSTSTNKSDNSETDAPKINDSGR